MSFEPGGSVIVRVNQKNEGGNVQKSYWSEKVEFCEKG